ncbi:MAG: IreB family regulatory phosphoprotein [Tissierellia bacterium]|nr:IreB family regulatory phosphoprotein [Tissierellia bacterium]
MDFDQTMKFNANIEQTMEPREILETVYDALKEKGYNPINQIIGYMLSGDPTYITSHKNARGIIIKMERDEILEVILREYLQLEDK